MITDKSKTADPMHVSQTFSGGFYTPVQMVPWPEEGWNLDFETPTGPEFRKTLEVEWTRIQKRRRPAKGYRRHIRRTKEAKR